MKKLTITTIITFLTLGFVQASELDSMYIYSHLSYADIHNVNDIDSIVYYAPTNMDLETKEDSMYIHFSAFDGSDSVIIHCLDHIDSIIYRTTQEKSIFDDMVEGVSLADAYTDGDGNSYPAVKIGSFIWMGENMRTTSYPDGSPILKASDEATWANLGDNNTDAAYCWYNNDSASYSQTYGALYTHSAALFGATPLTADNQDGADFIKGICSDGWHVASSAEWVTLINYMDSLTGKRLKDVNDWSDSGTDPLAFSALSSGYRSNTGVFANKGRYCYWWTSTETTDQTARRYGLEVNNTAIDYYKDSEKSKGFSVRCVKDY